MKRARAPFHSNSGYLKKHQSNPAYGGLLLILIMGYIIASPLFPMMPLDEIAVAYFGGQYAFRQF